MSVAPKAPSAFKRWLLKGYIQEPQAAYEGGNGHSHPQSPWYKVMCLTGVDYFSTLGYQPGIAFLAAGYLSPVATLILVLVTLFGALPVYRRVAKESPFGEGSIAMLEKLLPWWQGKLFVLAMLGFVATDFVITMTLSAADATAHLIENPFLEHFLKGQAVLVTLVLLGILGGIFLKGFSEAVGIAVVLVASYLFLNAILVFEGIRRIIAQPSLFHNWGQALHNMHGGGNVFLLVGAALLAFPKLALGLSGFETGVSVMPLIQGGSKDTERRPEGRIVNTHRLLGSAAIVMSVFLILTSVITTLLIPEAEFAEAKNGLPAGKANGRALAYLFHKFFGDGFGTVYDVSTILILSFAGASAMAGLLNIVPRYLPRYGMAPEWTKAARPLVLVFIAIAFIVTIIFKADVVAQGGAYATGVLVLMTSAAIAVTISARARGARSAYSYGVISLVFAYTTITNVFERPDGLRIALLFIGAIVLISLVSRIWRTLELRVDKLEMDMPALNFVRDAVDEGKRTIALIPNRPETMDVAEYSRQEQEAKRDHNLGPHECLLFVEVEIPDASEFSGVVRVQGVQVGEHRILRVTGTAIPNSIAALALRVRDLTGDRPHLYFNWGELNPALYLMKFLLSGKGDIAPLTREILRRVEPDPNRRPAIHVS